MKKRTAKRMITFLLAIVMVAAMPISINAADSSMNTVESTTETNETVLFTGNWDLFFDTSDKDYGKYNFAVNFDCGSANDIKVQGADVFTSFDWEEKLPYLNRDYGVRIYFNSTYQRKSHYTYGTVPAFVGYSFPYGEEKSGHFRLPESEFAIRESSTSDDPLGFGHWVKFTVEVRLYKSVADMKKDPNSYVSEGIFTVQYSDILLKLSQK